MSNEYLDQIEQIKNFNQQLTEYAVKVNKTVSAGISPIIEAQAKSAVKLLQSSVAHAEKLASAQSLEETLAEQKAITEELGTQFRSTAEELISIQQETSGELRALMEEGVEKFTPDALQNVFKQG